MSKSNLSVGTGAWADKINAAWRQSAAAIIDTGRILLEAKELTRHGDFERMIKVELDFSPQTARKLMAVAGDRRIIDRAHGRAFPDHWTTLYELTKLSDDELDQAFSSGVIGPKMQRADVPKPRRESPQGDAVLTEGTAILKPVAAAEVVTPQTDAKGEDSAVTMHPAATSDEADQQLRAGAAGAPHSDEVIFHVGSDAISRFANGLALAMAVSRELAAFDAAEQWPADMPLLSEELSLFADWMLDFEAAFRKRYDNGNDAALQSAVAE